MATTSNPSKAWVATVNAGGAAGAAGSSKTITINVTQQWEVQVPIGVRYGSSVSVATPVNVYVSNDGGATFDTEPLISFSIPAVASVSKVASIRLTTGMYAIQMIASSPSVTFFNLTQEVITAVVNV